eukprot:7387198-Prymnesium_polylepis.5
MHCARVTSSQSRPWSGTVQLDANASWNDREGRRRTRPRTDAPKERRCGQRQTLPSCWSVPDDEDDRHTQ